MTIVNNPKLYVSRAWSDLEPKLLGWLTGGTSVTAIIYILQRYFGIALDSTTANVIVVILGTLLGYFVHSNVSVSSLAAVVTPTSIAPYVVPALPVLLPPAASAVVAPDAGVPPPAEIVVTA